MIPGHQLEQPDLKLAIEQQSSDEHDARQESNSESKALEIIERFGVMRDSLLNYAGLAVSGAVNFMLVPLMLVGLGTQSYGIWAVALSVAGWAASVLDFGLFWSIARQAAELSNGRSQTDKGTFIRAGGAAYLMTGLIGGFIIAVLGVPLTTGMALSPGEERISVIVFALSGLGFAAAQLYTYCNSIFYGLRRFDLSSAISAAKAFFWGAGALFLLRFRADLAALAAWQLVAFLVAALVAYVLVVKMDPEFRFGLHSFNWATVRNHLAFSMGSECLTFIVALLWNTPAILIGMLLGASKVTPFHIGCKGPMAISWLSWNAAEVLFPAASAYTGQPHTRRRDLLEFGIRWNLVLILPWCVVLWTLAPQLLQLWLGKVDTETISITRLMTIAIFADSIAVPSLHVLWAAGITINLLGTLAATAIIEVFLMAVLLPRVGLAGAAWAAIAAFCFQAMTLVRLAAGGSALNAMSMLIAVVRNLVVPGLACVTIALLFMKLLQPREMVSLAIAVGAIALTYYGVVLFCGPREERNELWKRLRESVAFACGC